MGRDHTLFAKIDGVVSFSGNKTVLEVFYSYDDKSKKIPLRQAVREMVSIYMSQDIKTLEKMKKDFQASIEVIDEKINEFKGESNV